jgi:hypothetical protein
VGEGWEIGGKGNKLPCRNFIMHQVHLQWGEALLLMKISNQLPINLTCFWSLFQGWEQCISISHLYRSAAYFYTAVIDERRQSAANSGGAQRGATIRRRQMPMIAD